MAPSEKLFSLLIGSALTVLVLLHAIFVFLPAPQCWGINIFSFLPIEWGVALTAIALGAIGWGLVGNKNLHTPRTSSINIFSRSAIIIIPLVCGALFYFCSIPVALLGDGALFSGDLVRSVMLGQPVPLYREPLTMLLNTQVFSLLHSLNLTDDTLAVYQITGAAFGMLFVFVALKIASNVRASYRVQVLAFVLLISCGGVLLFFGYVENYAPQYAMDLLFVGLVFHMFRAKGSVVLPGVVLVLCCCLHLQNVLLIPSLVVALGLRAAQRKGLAASLGKTVYKYFAIAAPVLLLIYAFFMWKPIAPLQTGDNPFIPFAPIGAMTYTLLSPMHVLDIVNEHVLLAPVPIVLMFLFFVFFRRSIRWTAPEMVFVVVAAFALEAFLIGGNLRNGLARDWDVVASLGLMLTCIVILSLENISASIVFPARMLHAASLIALLGAIGWVTLNVNAVPEVSRYKSILEYHRSAVMPSVTRYGYENLRKMYFQKNDWENELATDAVMLEILPWHFDFMRLLIVAKDHAADSGSTSSTVVARSVATLVKNETDSTLRSERGGEEGQIRIAPAGGYPASLADLIEVAAIQAMQLYHTRTIGESLAFGDSILVHHPALPLGFEIKGCIELLSHDTISAAENFRRAAAFDPRRARPLTQLASCFDFAEARDSVRTISANALALDNGNVDAIAMLYATFRNTDITVRDTENLNVLVIAARRCLAQAKDRSLSAEQIQQIQMYSDEAGSALRQARMAAARLKE